MNVNWETIALAIISLIGVQVIGPTIASKLNARKNNASARKDAAEARKAEVEADGETSRLLVEMQQQINGLVRWQRQANAWMEAAERELAKLPEEIRPHIMVPRPNGLGHTKRRKSNA